MQFLKSFLGIPRSIQTHALQKIEEAVKSNKKFIILCAPTGSGKSHIAASIALSCKSPPQEFIEMVDDGSIFQWDNVRGYIHADRALRMGYHRGAVLTVSKALQDQYKSLFEDKVSVLKGKMNYPCRLDSTFGCDLSYCATNPKQKDKCLTSIGCPYYEARDGAIKNTFSVMNYSMALCMPDHAVQTEFLICDEASELEDELVNHFSVNINYKQLISSLGITHINKLTSEDPNIGMKWLSDLCNEIYISIKDLEQKITASKKKRKTTTILKELKKYRYLKELHNSVSILLANWYKSEIIIECGVNDVLFVPLYVNNFASALFNRAKHVLLMSAVIIDPVNFTKQLGIDDYVYIELDSMFDSNKSPIYCSAAKYNLGYNQIDKNLPKVIKQVKKICDHYKNDKGIIHTHNFKINEYIRQMFKDDKRFIYREAGINNEKLLEIHKNRKDPTILVSPSLAYGTDLPDELGRFQIVIKLPYLPLGSKRIKILFNKDNIWYQNKMLSQLLQSCGRCTRHINDFADTFILDGQILKILKDNWFKLPKYFKDRIH